MPEKYLLLFEDDDTTAKNVKDQLNYDFNVIHVKNKEELRDKLEPDLFSVIVTDVQIDGSDINATEILPLYGVSMDSIFFWLNLETSTRASWMSCHK